MSRTTTTPATIATTRTVLGPLTSTFTADALCTTTAAFQQSQGANSFYLGATCGNGAILDNTRCWPPASSPLPRSVFNGNANLNGLGMYSPGLHCPAGYQTACMQQKDGNGRDVARPTGSTSGTAFQFPLTADETAYGCCPSGFACGVNQSGAQTCTSIASSTTVAAWTCATAAFSNRLTYSFPGPSRATRSSNVAPILQATIHAPLIQIVHRARDLPATTTNSSQAPTGSTAAQSSSSSNTGAIAGGVVGGVVGLAVIVGLVLFLLSRYRKKRRAAGDGFDPLPPYDGRAGGYYAAKKEASPEGIELESGPGRFEADGAEVKPELVGSDIRYEMPGDTPQRPADSQAIPRPANLVTSPR